ncbi:MAG: hypothetical protein R3360_02805, partial [Alphaproteobacteria bacterium]|nr:hypothetical protein [Alphaproteobacteria bacterium]
LAHPVFFFDFTRHVGSPCLRRRRGIEVRRSRCGSGFPAETMNESKKSAGVHNISWPTLLQERIADS